jgi:hypothetical protein
VLAIQTVMPVGYTILLLSAEQSMEINATRRVVLRKCIKRAQRYQFALKCEEVSLQIEITTLPPKNHNLFVKLWNEKGIGEKGIAATG